MRDQILTFLSSIQGNYPTGVPRELVDSIKDTTPQINSEVQESGLKSGILFVWLDPIFSGDDFSCDTQGALLRAAIEKGLNLSLSEVTVCRGGREQIAAVLSDRKIVPEIWVFLGRAGAESMGLELKEGSFLMGDSADRRFSESRILVTRTPAECLSDSALKREFWEHLKRLRVNS